MNKLVTIMRNPVGSLGYITSKAYRNASVLLSNFYSHGSHHFSKDWDLLILLDTCRVDAVKEVKDEYRFINNIDRIYSLGGNSLEWIARTFDEKWSEELEDTAYLTSNSWAKWILDEGVNSDNPQIEHPAFFTLNRYGRFNTISPHQLGKLEHVWRYTPKYGDDEGSENIKSGGVAGGTPPRTMTDRGIDVIRNEDYDRVVLHYIQPT